MVMSGVAVVGAGHWGPHLVRNFSDHLASQVLWVVEANEDRRKAVAQRFPSIAVTSDLSDAIDDDRVDAVVVATPTSTHAEIARLALSAGKHVLVEKPITESVTEAVELCRTADSNELVLMVGHVFLFNNAFHAAKGYIESGHLGHVRYLSMTRTNLGPVRSDVNAAWDLASHDVSIANFWLGHSPYKVSASGGSWLNEGVEDVVFATLTYPGDVLVHVEASWLNPRKRRLISVVGSDRMLTVDDMDLSEPLRIYDKGVIGTGSADVTDTFAGFRSQVREGEVVIPHVTAGEPLKDECAAFLHSITSGDSHPSDGWNGARVVATLEAIDKSVASGGQEVDVEVV